MRLRYHTKSTGEVFNRTSNHAKASDVEGAEKAMRLQGALDTEIHIIAERLIERDGVSVDVDALYNALQRSNSSLKRRPKKTLLASLERVVDFICEKEEDGNDSQAEIEARLPKSDAVNDIMNKSLRANLAPAPTPLPPAGIMDETPRKRMKTGEAMPKRLKRSLDDRINTSIPAGLALDDIGGMDDVLEQLEEQIVLPLLSPEIYAQLSLAPPKGVLLHGPPGCGKTMISRALAAEIDLPFIEIRGPSVVSGMSGESEKAIREHFDEAKRQAPCIIFIDEIDAIAPKRDSSQSQMEKRMVAQLLVSMDELCSDPLKPVVVLAATNRPDSIDPALRRGGRFGSEINIGVPNEQVRKQILRAQTRNTPLSEDVDFAHLARLTAGFVGSDLYDLVTKAATFLTQKYRTAMKQQAIDLGIEIKNENSISEGILSIKRFVARAKIRELPNPPGFRELKISMESFLAVLPNITPSSKREGFATIPNVSWKDIGALAAVRESLREAIVYPIQRPELFRAVGLITPSGVLLWGPPGCGKTLLARAAAAESKANFISIKGPELLNKFVGESEAAVRKVFMRARSSVPCVIFFDELDALVPKRDEAGSEASSRVVNTLLTELDGLGEREGIYVIAATNRPDIIDDAMLRPGRFGKHLFVDVPQPDERFDIFSALARSKPIEITSEVANLITGPLCDGYSGADLSAIIQEGGLNAVRERRTRIECEDLQLAVQNVKGSVQDAAKYRALAKRFG